MILSPRPSFVIKMIYGSIMFHIKSFLFSIVLMYYLHLLYHYHFIYTFLIIFILSQSYFSTLQLYLLFVAYVHVIYYQLFPLIALICYRKT